MIDRKVSIMKEEGITFVTNTNVGKDVKAAKLLKEYDRVVLACGAKNPRDIKAPGRDAKGIYFAVDFLKATTKSLLDSDLKDNQYISAKGKKSSSSVVVTPEMTVWVHLSDMVQQA